MNVRIPGVCWLLFVWAWETLVAIPVARMSFCQYSYHAHQNLSSQLLARHKPLLDILFCEIPLEGLTAWITCYLSDAMFRKRRRPAKVCMLN